MGLGEWIRKNVLQISALLVKNVKQMPWNGQSCITLGFAPPNVQWIEQIVKRIADESGLSWAEDVAPFNSLQAVQNYTWDHPNRTLAALVFYPNYRDNTTMPNQVKYTMLVNMTTGEFDTTPLLQRAVDSAIMRQAANATGADGPGIDMSIGGYPKVKRRNVSHGDIVASIGSMWFYTSAMFPFIVLLQSLVGEKEMKLRESMYVAGLSRTAYWISWVLYIMAINIVQSLILFAAAAAFGFDLFRNSGFDVMLVVFVTFTLSMVPLSILVSVFVQRSRTANTVAFVFFIVGFLVQAFMSSFGITLLYDPNTTPIPRQIFVFYPPFNFAKCLSDMTQLAYPVFNTNTGGFDPGPGFWWTNLYQSVHYPLASYDSPPTIYSILWMLCNCAIFGTLALYLDNVLPGQGGSRKPFYFLLSPSYWGITRYVPEPHDPAPRDADPDIVAEAALAEKADASMPLRVMGLSKTYHAYPWASAADVHALRGLFLVVHQDSVLCLLGHNGAGKTTAINILTGADSADKGDAVVYGASVASEMDRVRAVLGVCPQHDVLWEELTAEDHLRLFAGLRALPRGSIDELVDKALEEVNLLQARSQAAGTFSGGMKRRLSVAIACIGDPKIIFLDEPTTGLDPVSRREVWAVVQHVKQGRAIILTTHNMEEADVLADRIAIVARGQLKCVGNGLHLKSKYGRGYGITVVTDAEHSASVIAAVRSITPAARVDRSTAGSVTFSVPLSDMDEIPKIFGALEGGSIANVKDWGLSHTTLEDVYLRVTLGDEPTAAPVPPVLSVNRE